MPSRTSTKPHYALGTHRRHEEGRRPAAPASSACEWDAVLAGKDWEAWQAHVRQRRWPRPLAELAPPGKTPPLLWSISERCDPPVVHALEVAGRLATAGEPEAVQFLQRLTEQRLLDSSGGHAASPDPAAFGMARLAWAHACPHLASAMHGESWPDLLRSLLACVEDAAAIPLDDDPLGRLLLGGELPWTLAYLFPELEVCRRLAASARETLSQGLVELLDGEGVPAAKHLPLLRPCLALWTRCGLMAEARQQECFTPEASEQYAWLVQRAILLSRPDGGQLLVTGTEGSWREPLFEAALSLIDDFEDEQLARAVLPLGPTRNAAPGRAARSAAVRTPPAFHSEWAEAALLRPAATRESPRLAVSYGERRLLAELTNRDAVVFSGLWAPEIAVDGRRLTSEGDWEEVCWVSDSDLDYLELEMSLSAGWRVQRQMLMARKDEFLFVADAVLGGEPGQIEYRGATPLPTPQNNARLARVQFQGEQETREGVLEGKKKLAVVLPLALPEWRVERGAGDLASTDRGLELTLTAAGRALFAPLFFDLAHRRFKKPRTWRRLTVAERLAIQPADVAVGYRVQVETEQWLFYRSLAKAANRTVLGQNLASEFVAARFTAKGLLEEFVSISSDA
jgi:hypothetical protein